MIIKSYRHAQILPLLPTLNEWLKLHFSNPPWNYTAPKDEILPPFLALYANDPNAILVTAEKGKDILGMLIGMPFDSLPNMPTQIFKSKNYDIHHLFFAGFFLLSSQLRRDNHTVHSIYEHFTAYAKSHNKPRIVRLELMTKHTLVEPWDIVGGFDATGIAIDLEWGKGKTLPMMFYINKS